MTISQNDAMYLQMFGFTQREIRDIQEAVDPAGNPQPPIDLNSPEWRQVIETRQQWIEEVQRTARKANDGKKFTKRKIASIIDSFYDNSDMTIWDWLKREYQKANVKGAPMNYIEAQRQRANQRTSAMRNAPRMRRKR